MKKRIACLLLTLVMIVSLIPTGAITASAEPLKVSEAGIRVIKDYMGFKKNAYLVGTEYRIGYGTPSVAGATITEANADKALREQLAALDTVVNNVGVPLVQKRHDALVWLSYIEGTGWIASALKTAVINGLTGSDFVDAMCTYSYAGGFPDDAASRGKIVTRMAIANLYLNGVYGAANAGSFGYTVFNAGEGEFAGGAKKMVKAFDRNQITAIKLTNPTCTGKEFLGWYDGSALVTGVGSATAGKTLNARWQTGSDKVTALYTLPAYVIYQASGIPDNQQMPVYKDPTTLVKIDEVSRDSVVTIVAEKIVGTDKWLELSTGGWVKFSAVGAVLPTIIPSVTVTITDDYVNIRKEPNVSSDKVGVAKRGETRTIVMTVGDAWGYCSQGWLYLAYTNYKQSGTSGTPVPGTGTPGTVVGAATVNVRSAAGVTNPLVTTVRQGTAVTVYEQTNVGTAAWGRIDQGWISMQYVQLKQNASTGSNAPAGSTVTVSSTTSLNIRSGPGTQYTKVGTLAPGTSVVVLRKQTVDGATWALIDQGWINMNYVTAGGSNVSGGSDNGIGGTVVNCATGVNIRSAAGPTGALVGVAALGSRVSITERVQVNGHYWGHMDRGWVCMDYIKLDREFPADTNTNTPAADDNIVTSFVGYPAVTLADTVVRQTASSDAASVMTLKGSTEVYITDRTVVGTNTFGKVTVGSLSGWINLKDVKLSPVNARVTAAKADAYELPNLRSQFYASLIQGTTVTVGNADGSGWALADGMLWGQTKVTVGMNEYAAWIKMNDVTMFKGNTLPTGITTLNGVGYLTGEITANTTVYKDSNGNVTTEEAGYTLVLGHRVNVLARNYIPSTGKTYAKVTVGNITGWINMDDVKLDTVVQQATSQLTVYDASFNATANTIAVGSKVTILTRKVVSRPNEINNGVADFGKVYVNDNPGVEYWIRLDEGKLVNVSTPSAPNNSNPSVVVSVAATGRAIGDISILEDAIVGSDPLLTVKNGTSVTVLNWKLVDGTVWGKVQIGQIVGWVKTSQIDFAGMTGIVAVTELTVYANPDKDSTRQVLRVNNKAIELIAAPVFDGSVVWGKINVADKTGWIDLSNVILSTPGAIINPELLIATGKVNSTAATVFLTETTSGIPYAEVKQLPKDTAVNLINVELSGGRAYWKIDLADKDGWMDMTYITVNPVTAAVTEASAEIYNDLMTAGMPGAQSLYTMYRGEKITVTSFALMNGSLFGQVSYGSTTGWILIQDSANNRKVSLTPGASGSNIGGGNSGSNGSTGNNGSNGSNTPTTPTEPAAPQGIAAYITCNTVVNVRAAADPTSTLVTTLPNGTAITILEQTTYIGKGWARIEQGWVCMDYVKMGTPPVNVNTGNGNVSIMTSVPAGAIAVGFANEDVKIRSGSGLGYPEVGSVKKGNSLVIYEKKLDGGMSWGRCDTGWVCLSYLTITGIGVSGSGSMGTIARCGYTANVRSSASSAGALMAKVMINSRVVVYETMVVGSETWGRTDLGWISMAYIAMDNQAASAPGNEPTAPTVSGGDNSVG